MGWKALASNSYLSYQIIIPLRRAFYPWLSYPYILRPAFAQLELPLVSNAASAEADFFFSHKPKLDGHSNPISYALHVLDGSSTIA